MKHRFNYEWTLKDAKFTKDKGSVFSCFACGGGSSFGYKLAGYDVIGCNEIDPKMMEAYRTNHNPKYSYLEPIQTFKLRDDLPKELYNLDILDGSPPCSSFSMAGNREKDWGKEKKFREGQAEQVLDNLFFDFIDLAEKLQPKIVVAENVKGLLMGEAKKYVRRIYESFKKAGYQLKIHPYLLDASKMGVPQKRERVFFIAIRNDLSNQFMEQADMFQKAPKLKLEFNEPEIPFKKIHEENGVGLRKKLYPSHSKYWDNRISGEADLSASSVRINNKKVGFNNVYVYKDKVLNTLTAHKDNACSVLFDEKRYLSRKEWIKGGSFPNDYNYGSLNEGYIIGMSVPPIMTANISEQIYIQWLSKIN